MKITETALGKRVETDVLILGAGAAGSGAAIAARREGVDVVLVEKGKLESCGSAGGGNDHFQAPLGTDRLAWEDPGPWAWIVQRATGQRQGQEHCTRGVRDAELNLGPHGWLAPSSKLNPNQG